MIISSIVRPFDVRSSFWACEIEDAAGLRRVGSALSKRQGPRQSVALVLETQQSCRLIENVTVQMQGCVFFELYLL